MSQNDEAQQGHGCWSHHNEMGCNNFRSDFMFIFGSCRTFFNESCPAGPPPGPVQYRGDYSKGALYGPGGCNCR
jgi:hypothetical protein